MKICFVPGDMDAPGFYRCLSPGLQLAAHGVEVEMPARKEISIPDPKDSEKEMLRYQFTIDFKLPRRADLYVFQQWKLRDLAENGISRLHRFASAVAIDVDDNYVSIPAYNPGFAGTHPHKHEDGHIINRAERRATRVAVKDKVSKAERRILNSELRHASNDNNRLHMLTSISQADLVTVSTPFLQEVYAPYNQNIQVIRNHVDWDMWEDATPQYEVERERTRIGYFGVYTYRKGDLSQVARPLRRFLRDHPDVDFVTNSPETHVALGVPEAQRVTLGEYLFYDPRENGYEHAYDNLARMTAQCDIGLIPMATNDLNRGKSHLKGMEYNAAGIPFIASPLDSYTDYWCEPGVNGFIARKEEDWYEWMDYLVGCDAERRWMGEWGRRKAEQHSIQRNWKEWYDAYADVVGDEYRTLARRANGVGAVQKPSELGQLLRLVAEKQPRTIVEIGTAGGGTFWAFAQLAPDDAHLVSIDIPAGSPLDIREGKDVYQDRDREKIRHFVKATQKLRLIDMDSQKPETYATLKAALAGRQIDLLFIDGDHRYQGVKHDYETYRQLVAPGGIIAFHDIVVHEDPRVGVHQLWDEIRDEHSMEFLGTDSMGYTSWGGIGVTHG